MRTIHVALALGLALTVTGAQADDLSIDWYSVDGGGGVSTGAGFELCGTIGQADAGAMSGGDFELVGGFWAAAPPFCYGDLDVDGQIGLSDLQLLLAGYGTIGGATYEDGDMNDDGDINLADLQLLLSVYGTTCP